MTPSPAARLAALFRRHGTTFDRLAGLATVRLTDERVHDLRVLSRRLRTAVALGRRLASHDGLGLLRRRLRTLGRVLGVRRALDVAAEDFTAAAPGRELPGLAERRRAASVPVLRRLSARRRAALASALKSSARAVSVVPGRPPGLRKYVASGADRLQDALAHAREARTKEADHLLRIAAKKARYVLETVRAMGIHSAVRAEGRLKDLQGLLGRAHDYEVLLDLMKGVVPRRDRAWPLVRAAEVRLRRRGRAAAGPAVHAAAAALARAGEDVS